MRPSGISIVLVLALAATFALADLAGAQSGSGPTPARTLASPIGKVMTAAGTVTVERASAAAIQASVANSGTQLKEGDLVYRGDVVATGPDGKVSLVFADGTAFNVSSNARMELNEFVYTPDGRSNSSMFSLLKGAFTFVAGKIAKTGSMKLDTPAATMGIRGTTPYVIVSEDGTVKFSTLVEEKR
jgi:hypothetical protein